MAQNSDADHELVASLHRLAKKSPKLVRSSTYPAPADSTVIIRSWKMNEFKYYEIPSPFPTLARGLFTRWDGEEGEVEGESGGNYKIVARGYDKFFNVGEVPWTSWKALEKHTSPPYVLTLKSNGCIIFIAPLSPSKLVVTSKHSIGPLKGQERSHAQVGEKWLQQHLSKAGKTEEQLAKVLWDNGWTAVAELCDDSFEEHVLAYPEELTGLHLHGLNHSAGAFQTRDPEDVAAFAREWGFIRTAYTSLGSVAEVKQFTEDIGKSGKWNNQPIEGFVVRTHIAAKPFAPAEASDALNVSGEQCGRHSREDRDAPPYPPGSSFFFKVKFGEPYMMYRDWRELTKSILTAKAGTPPRISKAKLARPETRLFKQWVEGEIKSNRKAFDGYTHGKGIIATRESFLRWCEEAGKDKLAQELEKPGMVEQSDGEKQRNQFGKTVIVPVAIPGCGKTSVAVALTRLFGFGHTQSDDVKAKKAAPRFLKNVADLLETHDVVIADKNNHLAQHRLGLREKFAHQVPLVRLLALNWALEQPPAIIHRICSDRVQSRGENHQTLRADEHKGHEDVIWKFMETTEGLVADEVDETIEMDVCEELDVSLSRAIDGVVRVLGLERPADEAIAEALRLAKTYAPPRPKHDPPDKATDARKKGTEARAQGNPPRYFGLLPEVDIQGVVGGRLAEHDVPPTARALWDGLRTKGRIAKRPHMTVVHSKGLPREQALWDRCMALHRAASPPSFTVSLGHVVYDERVMAVVVEGLDVVSGEGAAAVEEGLEFVENVPRDLQERLHITVGTRDDGVNPYEARGLVEAWRRGANVSSIALKDAKGQGRIKGLFS